MSCSLLLYGLTQEICVQPSRGNRPRGTWDRGAEPHMLRRGLLWHPVGTLLGIPQEGGAGRAMLIRSSPAAASGRAVPAPRRAVGAVCRRLRVCSAGWASSKAPLHRAHRPHSDSDLTPNTVPCLALAPARCSAFSSFAALLLHCPDSRGELRRGPERVKTTFYLWKRPLQHG